MWNRVNINDVPEYEGGHEHEELHEEKESQHAHQVPQVGEGHAQNEGLEKPRQSQTNRHVKNADQQQLLKGY